MSSTTATDVGDFIDEIEQEVRDEIYPNDHKVFSIEFPYVVEFNLNNDDVHTKVIIETRSVDYKFAKTEEDALQQQRMYDKYGSKLMSNYIINYVSNALSDINLDDVKYKRVGRAEVKEIDDPDSLMDEIQKGEIISVN